MSVEGAAPKPRRKAFNDALSKLVNRNEEEEDKINRAVYGGSAAPSQGQSVPRDVTRASQKHSFDHFASQQRPHVRSWPGWAGPAHGHAGSELIACSRRQGVVIRYTRTAGPHRAGPASFRRR
jgi:hypothetical protein